ncbi:TrmB family transcriptional regulator [bacterium]|nr:TrmB family transcriptional regulator [bacterium]
MENLIEKLKELGFSGNEAKVYLALIKKFPLTGYEISKMANIQQARAYDALKSLEAKQVVTVSDEKPAAYTPIRPKELTKRYKRKITSTLDFLDKKLPSIKETVSEPIVPVYGEKEVDEKITELFRSAKKELYILISSGDYREYEQNIFDAYNRGVEIKISGYDNFSASFGQIFAQSPLSVLDSKMATRTILIVADSNEGLYGTLKPNPASGLPELIWSKNSHVIHLIKSYIILSMYITDIESKFPEQLRYFYGAGMKKLREKVLN